MLVPEIVDKIISLLPTETYNKVYGYASKTSIYDEVPETIIIGGRFGQWERPPSFRTVISLFTLCEFIDIHYRLPFFPTHLVVAEFTSEDIFFEAHKKCPEILKLYKITIKNPTIKLTELDPFPYVVESIGPAFSTDFYPKYCTKLIVGANEMKKLPFTGNWDTIVIEETDNDGIDFNDINQWNTPYLSHMELAAETPMLTQFEYTLPLQTLEIRSPVVYLPNLMVFNVNKLKLILSHDRQLLINRYIQIPNCVQDLEITSSDRMVIDIIFPENLKRLKLRNIITAIGISDNLVELNLDPVSNSMDLSEYSEIKELLITRDDNDRILTLTVPKTLRTLSTNFDYDSITNISELNDLTSLSLFGTRNSREASVPPEIIIPPNVTSCYIPTFSYIKLTLNDKLEALLLLSYPTIPLKIPQSMKWLELMEYSFPLELPENLQVLKLECHSTPVKTPKNLRLLSIENSILTEIDLKLNPRLKKVYFDNVKFDFNELKFLHLESMQFKRCEFVNDLVPN